MSYKVRVIEEQAELKGRLKKLKKFLDSDKLSSVNSQEQVRLKRQEKVMEKYNDILSERIANFD